MRRRPCRLSFWLSEDFICPFGASNFGRTRKGGFGKPVSMEARCGLKVAAECRQAIASLVLPYSDCIETGFLGQRSYSTSCRPIEREARCARAVAFRRNRPDICADRFICRWYFCPWPLNNLFRLHTKCTRVRLRRNSRAAFED